MKSRPTLAVITGLLLGYGGEGLAEGVFAGNKPVSSDPIPSSFAVLKPVVKLTTEHVDLRVLYTADSTNSLSMVVVDDDHQIVYAPDECILVVAEAGKSTLPAGTPFGSEGDPIYILPQSQNPELLSLGLSTEDIAAGVFSGTLNIRLMAVAGPGNFFLWQADSGGNFNVKMNSADGIGAADQNALPIDSHEHNNFGYTTPGVYRVTFQITGRRFGDTDDIISLPTPITFHVLPLPTEEAQLRIIQIEANGDLRIEVAGSPGATYDVQTSEDLKTWNSFQLVTLTGATATVTVPATGAKRFVRAIRP